MGIIFRPHRGSLDAAMAEAKEFNNEEEMKKHIFDSWNRGWKGEGTLFDVDDIVINDESMTNDERIGWEDSKYVCVKRMGGKTYEVPQCIGMCATKYKPLN